MAKALYGGYGEITRGVGLPSHGHIIPASVSGTDRQLTEYYRRQAAERRKREEQLARDLAETTILPAELDLAVPDIATVEATTLTEAIGASAVNSIDDEQVQELVGAAAE